MVKQMNGQKDGLIIEVNKRGQLVVDIGEADLIAMFKNKMKRNPRSRDEAAEFLHVVVSRRLKRRGLIK